MNLHDYLNVLESRAALALAIVGGLASDDETRAFADTLGLSPDDDIDAEADTYLTSPGYPFTREAGSPVVAVLAVGGPDIRLIRDRTGYTLTAYSPGHPGASRASQTISRWGRMIDLDPDGNGYICKRCGGPSPMGIGYADRRIGARAASQAVTACQCGYSRA